jgi:GNAT superfamily N-acetyltransferase
LIKELAAYEREPDAVQATEADLHGALFGANPALFGLIADVDPEGSAESTRSAGTESRGEIAGFALWFLNFSTWLGKHGIYLEDLYVRPDFRGHGYGKALLAELTTIAASRGYGRVEWAVLNWNEPAHRFYESLGAAPQSEWTTWRLTGDKVAGDLLT